MGFHFNFIITFLNNFIIYFIKDCYYSIKIIKINYQEDFINI